MTSQTPLEAVIRAEIAERGPMGLDRYMALCLAHPQHGYYRKQDPLGMSGDFVTAPEISQIFGELIGLWVAQCWLDQGRPAPFALVETGPGRGTLMADALRATRAVPGFHDGMQLNLVETSPVLRGRQKETLRDYDVTWRDRFDETPDLPLLLVANEFFDALPIRQFERAGDGWRERLVAIVDEKLDLQSGPLRPEPHLSIRGDDLPEGGLIETSEISETIAAEIGEQLRARGGAALIIDYGYDATMRSRAGGVDTIQAMRDHNFVNPFDDPGEADLTAHVDFDALASAANVRKHGIVDQGAFLLGLGAAQRAEALAKTHPDQAHDVKGALHRLTDASEMGTLFKAMALTADPAPPPAAFPA